MYDMKKSDLFTYRISVYREKNTFRTLVADTEVIRNLV